MDEETRLDGGNTTAVMRVGDTVRRPVGSWTPAVHALLKHLHAVGFDGSPRVLGIDERSREILGFVPGSVGTLSAEAPLVRWFRTPDACWAIGRWIRDFQTAQESFVADPMMPWRLAPAAVLRNGQVIAHHDVSPYNTVRRPDGSLVVLDWDFCRPGDPLEDLAWAVWRWVPLMAGTWWRAEFGFGPEEDARALQERKVHALLEGHGPSREQRLMLAGAIVKAMRRHAVDLEAMARTDPAFIELVGRGYASRARADAIWWESSDLAASILG